MRIVLSETVYKTYQKILLSLRVGNPPGLLETNRVKIAKPMKTKERSENGGWKSFHGFIRPQFTGISLSIYIGSKSTNVRNTLRFSSDHVWTAYEWGKWLKLEEQPRYLLHLLILSVSSGRYRSQRVKAFKVRSITAEITFHENGWSLNRSWYAKYNWGLRFNALLFKSDNCGGSWYDHFLKFWWQLNWLRGYWFPIPLSG